MSKRRKNQSDAESVILVLLFVFVAGYFLIKWTIELIVAIITGIVWICTKIAGKIEDKKKVDNVTKKPFENTTYIGNKVSKKNIIDKFELKDLNKYDSLPNKDEEEDNARYIEKELDNWGLTEEEKRIVRATDYDPWDFDEEDMDEDSYYYEDDK